ncbi:MAG TPA: hypothetical protein VEC03_06490, partial [Ramlibacter sp.]|nr:hypothetical protein [Ramlibacter sp.]
MKARHLTLVLALASAAASAQVSQEDHSAHHPEGSTPPAAAAPAPAPAQAGGPPMDQRYADQMKQMQDMHARMQAAKTPRERSALMDEHMKLMQSGMDLMRQMGGMG